MGLGESSDDPEAGARSNGPHGAAGLEHPAPFVGRDAGAVARDVEPARPVPSSSRGRRSRSRPRRRHARRSVPPSCGAGSPAAARAGPRPPGPAVDPGRGGRRRRSRRRPSTAPSGSSVALTTQSTPPPATSSRAVAADDAGRTVIAFPSVAVRHGLGSRGDGDDADRGRGVLRRERRRRGVDRVSDSGCRGEESTGGSNRRRTGGVTAW